MSVSLAEYAWECVCVWLWKWATDGRFSGFSLPVDGLSVAMPGPGRRVRRGEGRGERGGEAGGGGGSGRAGEGRTSEQQRAAGAIIPPNAPCLQPCLQWLSGEWQIECTHAKGYLGDQVPFSGVGAAQAACLQRPVWTLVCSVQQRRRYSAADSAEPGTLCRRWSCIM